MFLMEVRKEHAAATTSRSFFSSLRQRLQKEFAPSPDTAHRSKYLNLALIVAPFGVPAVLYTITNNLGIAIQMEMDPATYQVGFPSLFICVVVRNK